MFIIRTLRGDVKADHDELERIAAWKGKGLVFLRNGAVNPAHITNIVPDEERRGEILRGPGETDLQLEERIKNDRSQDIFESVRKKIAVGGTLALESGNI